MENTGNPKVLHIVGKLTEAVFSFLGPATEALTEAGYSQTIVMLDDPKYRHIQSTFPAKVRLETIPLESLVRGHWWVMARLVEQLIATQQYSAYHLHGFLPWALGTRMGRLIPRGAQVFYSPHGSRTLSLLRPVQSILGSVMSTMGPTPPKVIASSVSDAQRVSPLTPGSVITIEAAIDDEYFHLQRSEARRPLLVSGDTDTGHRSVELFCRLAVVLSAAELGLSFNWIGSLDPLSAARLKAANVGTFPISEHKEMASKLAPGWIFVAAGDADEFPILLGKAMALGMPCVVSNTAQHSTLISHGQNGLIYHSEDEALALISKLIDDQTLRARLGAAAKASALGRLSRDKLDQSVVSAYSLGMDTPISAAMQTDPPSQ